MVTAVEMYEAVTAGRTRFVRVETLCDEAAARFPDALPSREILTAEAARAQRDKTG